MKSIIYACVLYFINLSAFDLIFVTIVPKEPKVYVRVVHLCWSHFRTKPLRFNSDSPGRGQKCSYSG